MTRALSTAMAVVGAALNALPLEELPPVACIHVTCPGALRVSMQLSSRCQPSDLPRWAEAVDQPRLIASWGHTADFIHLELRGRVGGIGVRVWDHIRRDLLAAADLLGLPKPGDVTEIQVDVATLQKLEGALT